jgi:hypothetical protein
VFAHYGALNHHGKTVIVRETGVQVQRNEANLSGSMREIRVLNVFWGKSKLAEVNMSERARGSGTHSISMFFRITATLAHIIVFIFVRLSPFIFDDAQSADARIFAGITDK